MSNNKDHLVGQLTRWWSEGEMAKDQTFSPFLFWNPFLTYVFVFVFPVTLTFIRSTPNIRFHAQNHTLAFVFVLVIVFTYVFVFVFPMSLTFIRSAPNIRFHAQKRTLTNSAVHCIMVKDRWSEDEFLAVQNSSIGDLVTQSVTQGNLLIEVSQCLTILTIFDNFGNFGFC